MEATVITMPIHHQAPREVSRILLLKCPTSYRGLCLRRLVLIWLSNTRDYIGYYCTKDIFDENLNDVFVIIADAVVWLFPLIVAAFGTNGVPHYHTSSVKVCNNKRD